MPVIDLKKRLGIEQTPYTALSRIVTVIVGDLQVGMLVDSVTEVLTIRSRLVDPKKTVSDKAMEKFLSGIGNIDGRLVTMLNLEGVINLADSTSVIMNLTTTAGKKSSKSITDVDPNASNGDIKNFFYGLNSITTYTLGTITKVSKSEIENVTYYDLSLTATKSNDSNNAITISGKNITIDSTKIVDTSDLDSMTSLTLKFTVNNNAIDTGKFIVEGNGDFFNDGYLMTSGTSVDSHVGISIVLYKPSSAKTGTVTLTIPAGKYSTYNYNACTVNFNIE